MEVVIFLYAENSLDFHYSSLSVICFWKMIKFQVHIGKQIYY